MSCAAIGRELDEDEILAAEMGRRIADDERLEIGDFQGVFPLVHQARPAAAKMLSSAVQVQCKSYEATTKML